VDVIVEAGCTFQIQLGTSYTPKALEEKVATQVRGSQQQTHTSKSQKGLPKSPSINLLECRSHQQGQPKERKKSLSARVSRKKKKACWHSLEERRLRCGRKLDRREPFGPPLEETRKQLACQIPFGEALASTKHFQGRPGLLPRVN